MTINWFETPIEILYPNWLWALLPILLLSILYGLVYSSKKYADWQQQIDQHLLKSLQFTDQKSSKNIFPILLLLALLMTVLALTGPSIKKEDIPTYNNPSSTVIILSLSASMDLQDIKPSRLARAKHKMNDILSQTQGDMRGLVIYSDTSFVATPLTKDENIIVELLPSLSTQLMPITGNRLDLAITSAHQLLERSQVRTGHIIVLADSIGAFPEKSQQAVESAFNQGYKTSVLAVGEKESMQLKPLEQLVEKGGGLLSLIQLDDTDIIKLLSHNFWRGEKSFLDKQKTAERQKVTAHYQNIGYWFLLFPLLVLLLLFRKKTLWVWVIVMGSYVGLPYPSFAQENKEPLEHLESSKYLWKTADQQGQLDFDQKKYQQAEKHFTQKNWQAASAYKAKNYSYAAEQFKQLNQYYNHANALAQLGDFKGAIKSYDQALSENPNHQGAKKNKQLIEKILEEQKSEENQSEENQSEENQSEENQSEENQSEENQSEENQSEENQSEENQSEENQSEENQSEENQSEENQSEENQSEENQSEENQSEENQSEENQSEDPKDLPEWDNDAANPLTEKDGDLLSEEELLAKQKAQAQPEDEFNDPDVQIIEQQLRKVPDDPAALLKYRIEKYHYYQK